MYKIQISLENVLCMILWAEEHKYVGNYWKRRVLWTPLLSLILLPGLVQIGSGHVVEQSYCQSKQLLDTADVDGGLRTATGTSKCTPPPHLHLCTQSLDFWIQEVEDLMNSTSCISTTCRHPLACSGYLFDMDAKTLVKQGNVFYSPFCWWRPLESNLDADNAMPENWHLLSDTVRVATNKIFSMVALLHGYTSILCCKMETHGS